MDPDRSLAILLENYCLPVDLAAQMEAIMDHYNHQRTHESLSNVTPPPTSTSDETKPFFSNGKGLNATHLKRDACITDNTPQDQTNKINQLFLGLNCSWFQNPDDGQSRYATNPPCPHQKAFF
jgi:hypothetical protein